MRALQVQWAAYVAALQAGRETEIGNREKPAWDTAPWMAIQEEAAGIVIYSPAIVRGRAPRKFPR